MGHSVETIEGEGPNRVLKLTLKGLANVKNAKVEYRSLVLVRPTDWSPTPRAGST